MRNGTRVEQHESSESNRKSLVKIECGKLEVKGPKKISRQKAILRKLRLVILPKLIQLRLLHSGQKYVEISSPG